MTQTPNRYLLLEEYIKCLQRQNQTKNIERQTLYIELEKLQHQLNVVECELKQARSMPQAFQTTSMKCRICDLEQQITILKYQQQHLFEQNLSLVHNLEESSSKMAQVERQNRQLKCQKEELQKFRISLQKISKNLEQIEMERFALGQANVILLEENDYLKRLIICRQQQSAQEGYQQYSQSDIVQQIPQIRPQQLNQYIHPLQPHLHQPSKPNSNNQPPHQQQSTPISTYLMSSSFEKISQYEQQYQQSNQNSQSKSYSKSMNKQLISSDEKMLDEGGEEDDEDNQMRVYQQQDGEQMVGEVSMRQHYLNDKNNHSKLNQSSYLIFDERSGQSVSLSFQQSHHLLPLDTNNQQKNNSSTQKISPRNYHQQSSNDVIQQLQQEQQNSSPNSSSLTNNVLSCQINNNNNNINKHPTQHCNPPNSYSQPELYQKQILSLKKQLLYSQKEKRALELQIKQMELSQSKNMNQMESKIQELLKNYQLIVKYVERLEIENTQLKHQMGDLVQHVEELQKFKSQAEDYCYARTQEEQNRASSFKNSQLMNQQQLEHYQNGYQEQKQQHLSVNYPDQAPQQKQLVNDRYFQLSNGIAPIDLIKQNNHLIQRVNELQMQASSLYKESQSSNYSHNSKKKANQHEIYQLQAQCGKENIMNSLNYHQALPPNQSSSRSFNHPRKRLQDCKTKRRNSFIISHKNHTNQQSSYPLLSRREVYSFSVDNHIRSQSIKEILQQRIQLLKQQNLSLLKQLDYQ